MNEWDDLGELMASFACSLTSHHITITKVESTVCRGNEIGAVNVENVKVFFLAGDI